MNVSRKKSKKKTTGKDISDPNSIKGIHQFVMGEKLGQGTFGKVRLATHIVTGEKVAIKILEKDKIYQQEDKERVEKEIKILKMIRHNNLIQVYQVIQTPTLIYIVMEYSSGKDMFDYIVNNKKFKEDEACHYFQQLIEGVDYCHKLKICHRDLKPENLLMEGNTIKLIDFGLSNTWGKSGKLKTACGSPSYAAPEMILGEDNYYGSRVDVWSCGVILYVMVCGFLPFEDANQDKLYKKIIDGKFALPSFISDTCKDLIRKIMNVDQEKRFTIAEIKSHPWYKSIAPKINEGLLSTKIVLPTDEDIIEQMRVKGFNIRDVRESIIMNNHNHLTTSYYLLVKSKIKQGLESESDLFSNRYIKYIKNNENLLSFYENDLFSALQDRQAKGEQLEKERKEKEKNEQESGNIFAVKPSGNNLTEGGGIFGNANMNTQANGENEDNNNKETNDLIENLKSLNTGTTGIDITNQQSSNPFEVSMEIRNSIREVNFNDPTIVSGKTIVVTTNKKAFIRPNPLKRKEKLRKEMRLNRPRNENKTTTFDCRNIGSIKQEQKNVVDKYEMLRERVESMRSNIQFGLKTTFRGGSVANSSNYDNVATNITSKSNNKKKNTGSRFSHKFSMKEQSESIESNKNNPNKKIVVAKNGLLEKKSKLHQTNSEVKEQLK